MPPTNPSNPKANTDVTPVAKRRFHLGRRSKIALGVITGLLVLSGEVLAEKRRAAPEMPDLVAVPSNEKVGRAIDLLGEYGISQVPVARSDKPEDISEIVGSIQDRSLLERVLRDRDALVREVAAVMDAPLPVVQTSAGVEEMFSDLSRGAEAIVVAEGSRPIGVLSRADLLEYLAHQAR